MPRRKGTKRGTTARTKTAIQVLQDAAHAPVDANITSDFAADSKSTAVITDGTCTHVDDSDLPDLEIEDESTNTPSCIMDASFSPPGDGEELSKDGSGNGDDSEMMHTGFMQIGPNSYRCGSTLIDLNKADEETTFSFKPNDIGLEVECGGNCAIMYLSKLYQGSKGQCIEFQDKWITPNEFQAVSGRESAKDWKRSIRHKGRSLKLLLSKGVLDVHPAACRCDSCRLLQHTNEKVAFGDAFSGDEDKRKDERVPSKKKRKGEEKTSGGYNVDMSHGVNGDSQLEVNGDIPELKNNDTCVDKDINSTTDSISSSENEDSLAEESDLDDERVRDRIENGCEQTKRVESIKVKIPCNLSTVQTHTSSSESSSSGDTSSDDDSDDDENASTDDGDICVTHKPMSIDPSTLNEPLFPDVDISNITKKHSLILPDEAVHPCMKTVDSLSNDASKVRDPLQVQQISKETSSSDDDEPLANINRKYSPQKLAQNEDLCLHEREQITLMEAKERDEKKLPCTTSDVNIEGDHYMETVGSKRTMLTPMKQSESGNSKSMPVCNNNESDYREICPFSISCTVSSIYNDTVHFPISETSSKSYPDGLKHCWFNNSNNDVTFFTSHGVPHINRSGSANCRTDYVNCMQVHHATSCESMSPFEKNKLFRVAYDTYTGKSEKSQDYDEALFQSDDLSTAKRFLDSINNDRICVGARSSSDNFAINNILGNSYNVNFSIGSNSRVRGVADVIPHISPMINYGSMNSSQTYDTCTEACSTPSFSSISDIGSTKEPSSAHVCYSQAITCCSASSVNQLMGSFNSESRSTATMNADTVREVPVDGNVQRGITDKDAGADTDIMNITCSPTNANKNFGTCMTDAAYNRLHGGLKVNISGRRDDNVYTDPSILGATYSGGSLTAVDCDNNLTYPQLDASRAGRFHSLSPTAMVGHLSWPSPNNSSKIYSTASLVNDKKLYPSYLSAETTFISANVGRSGPPTVTAQSVLGTRSPVAKSSSCTNNDHVTKSLTSVTKSLTSVTKSLTSVTNDRDSTPVGPNKLVRKQAGTKLSRLSNIIDNLRVTKEKQATNNDMQEASQDLPIPNVSEASHDFPIPNISEASHDFPFPNVSVTHMISMSNDCSESSFGSAMSLSAISYDALPLQLSSSSMSSSFLVSVSLPLPQRLRSVSCCETAITRLSSPIQSYWKHTDAICSTMPLHDHELQALPHNLSSGSVLGSTGFYSPIRSSSSFPSLSSSPSSLSTFSQSSLSSSSLTTLSSLLSAPLFSSSSLLPPVVPSRNFLTPSLYSLPSLTSCGRSSCSITITTNSLPYLPVLSGLTSAAVNLATAASASPLLGALGSSSFSRHQHEQLALSFQQAMAHGLPGTDFSQAQALMAYQMAQAEAALQLQQASYMQKMSAASFSAQSKAERDYQLAMSLMPWATHRGSELLSPFHPFAHQHFLAMQHQQLQQHLRENELDKEKQKQHQKLREREHKDDRDREREKQKQRQEQVARRHHQQKQKDRQEQLDRKQQQRKLQEQQQLFKQKQVQMMQEQQRKLDVAHTQLQRDLAKRCYDSMTGDSFMPDRTGNAPSTLGKSTPTPEKAHTHGNPKRLCTYPVSSAHLSSKLQPAYSKDCWNTICSFDSASSGLLHSSSSGISTTALTMSDPLNLQRPLAMSQDAVPRMWASRFPYTVQAPEQALQSRMYGLSAQSTTLSRHAASATDGSTKSPVYSSPSLFNLSSVSTPEAHGVNSTPRYTSTASFCGRDDVLDLSVSKR